jgi:IS30 family transposase
MYHIKGQPINFRNVARAKFADDKLSEYALSVIKIVEFGKIHGYKASIDAFGISRSTYYHYLRLYQEYKQYNIPINIKSKRPYKLRQANWNKRVINFIMQIRQEHPNIGKSKIKPYLDNFCIKNNIAIISTGTIQNIINSFADKLRTASNIKKPIRRNNVLRKPAKYQPRSSGECVALDSMEFRLDGKKSYVVVVKDEVTKLMYARATNSHTSLSATEIFKLAHNYLPWDNFNTILTDNGSEFAKHFAHYIAEQGVTHYHTYPKSPKQNASCERLNRTIQDEFMIKYGELLFDDINLFNKKLLHYIHWYNCKRVHATFNNKMTPFQKHLELQKSGKIVS